MSEEIKYEHDHDHSHEHDCICKSKGFRKFLVVALGSFVGVFCALCLFCALHKPPMMMGPYGMQPMFGMPMAGVHNCNCCCHKKMMKKFLKYHNEMKKDVENKVENED